MENDPTQDAVSMPLRLLVPGERIEGAVCLRRLTAGTTKDGASYLTVELCNASGVVSGRIWRENVDAWQTFAVGDPLYVRGSVKAGWKKGPPEIVVAHVEALPRPHAVELEINAICPVPLARLRARFEHLLATLTPPGEELLRVVLESVGEADWWDAPAAKQMHHAYIHGLAEHCIEVCELALAIARTTSSAHEIQYDHLIVGALLHDVAKTSEYRYRGVPIDLSHTAHLTYHTCSGPVMTQVAIERHRDRLALAGVTKLDVDHLCHVQLSHHGVAEFGSPVPPATIEAAIIHHADNISAKLRGMLDDLAANPVDAEGWVVPTGCKRTPVLSLMRAPRTPLVPDDGFGARAAAEASLEAPPDPITVEDSDDGYRSNVDERPHGFAVPLVRLRIIT